MSIMAYYYAVKNGKNPGIYSTWAECEKQVKGFPNAQFKKWKTKDERKLIYEPKRFPPAQLLLQIFPVQEQVLLLTV